MNRRVAIDRLEGPRKLPGHGDIIAPSSFRVDCFNVITVARSQRNHVGSRPLTSQKLIRTLRRNIGGASRVGVDPLSRVRPGRLGRDQLLVRRIFIRAEVQFGGIIRTNKKDIVAGSRRRDVAAELSPVIVREIDRAFEQSGIGHLVRLVIGEFRGIGYGRDSAAGHEKHPPFNHAIGLEELDLGIRRYRVRNRRGVLDPAHGQKVTSAGGDGRGRQQHGEAIRLQARPVHSDTVINRVIVLIGSGDGSDLLAKDNKQAVRIPSSERVRDRRRGCVPVHGQGCRAARGVAKCVGHLDAK